MMRARGAGISILGGLFFHFGIPCALPQDGPWGKFSKRSVLMMLLWGALGGLKNHSKIRARKAGGGKCGWADGRQQKRVCQRIGAGEKVIVGARTVRGQGVWKRGRGRGWGLAGAGS